MTDAELRQKYVEDGWGKIAVEMKMDPLCVESVARDVMRKLYEERVAANAAIHRGIEYAMEVRMDAEESIEDSAVDALPVITQHMEEMRKALQHV